MKKITLLLLTFFMSFVGYSQGLTENFDGGTSLPTGWVAFNNGQGTAPRPWRVFASTSPSVPSFSPPNSAFSERYQIGQGNTSQDWLATTAVTLPANAQLQFVTRQRTDGDQGTLYRVMVARVSAGAQNNPAIYQQAQEWTELTLNPEGPFNGDGTPRWDEHTVSLSALGYNANEQVYIAFVRVFTQPDAGNSADVGWHVDDVRVSQKCAMPTGMAAPVINMTSAELTWNTPAGGATSWEVVIVPDNLTLEQGIAAGNLYTYNGTMPFRTADYTPAITLNPDTNYKYYVRAVCSPTNKSDWTLPYFFTTASLGETCAEPIVIPQIPYQVTDNTNNSNDRLDQIQGSSCGATPAGTNFMAGNEVFYTFTAPETGEIRIRMTPTAANSSLFVYNGCANVGVSCIAGVANTGSGVRTIPALAVTAGQSYVIVISSAAANQTVGYTLNIQYVTCDEPTGLQADATMTTALLSWNNPAGSTATSWQIAVQPAGAQIPTTPGTNVTSNTNLLVTETVDGTPLQAATAYQYWVRVPCVDGGTTYSPWAGPFPFNTRVCEPVDQCNYTFRMTRSSGGGYGGAIMHVRQNGVTVAVLGPNFTSGTASAVQVPLCNGIPFELFWIEGGSSAANIGITVQNSFNQLLYTKTAGTGSPSADTPLFSKMVDCVTPMCPSPINLSSNTVLANSANLNWTPGSLPPPAGATTQWQIYVEREAVAVAPLNTAPTSAYPVITTRPYPATGLVSDTWYVFYVRTYCGDGWSSEWSGPHRFKTAVSCGAPTNLGASGQTTSSANLFWTQPALGGATAWEVVVQAPGTGAPDLAPANAQPLANGGTYSGLNAATQYEFYVRANCSATDNSSWSGPFLFYTACNPVNVPYTEGFNSTSTNELCWSVVNVSGSNTWDLDYNVTPSEGNQVASILPNSGNQNDDWLITPSLRLLSNYRLRFKYKVLASAANNNNIEIKLSTTGSAPASFTETLMPVTTWSNTAYLEKVINLNDFGNDDGSVLVHIGWHLPQGVNNSTRIFIDEVVLEPIPSCSDPMDLTVGGITATSALLSWTPGFNETQWQVVVQPVGTGVPNPNYTGPTTNINTDYPANTNGNLAPATFYEYYVRAYCSATDTSEWVGPLVFQTACDALDVPYYEGFNSNSEREFCWTVNNANNDSATWNMNFATNPYEGNQVASIATSGASGNNDDWLISPILNVTGNQRLRFRYRVQSAGSPGRFEVLLSTQGASDLSQFTTVIVPSTSYSNTTYLESVTNLGTYSGRINIAWHIPPGPSNGSRVFIDQVIIEDIPSCPSPTNMVVDCISGSGANMAWTPVAGETSWEVAVVPSGGQMPQNGALVYEPSYFAQGLQQETDYNFWIRSVCPAGIGGYGPWEPADFSTITRSISDANPFCGNDVASQTILFPNTHDGQNIPELGDIACLGSTPNPVWYYLQVDEAGDLDFRLIQNTAFDANGNPIGTGLDVDFVAYGPFTSLNQACQQIDLVTCPSCPNNTGNPNFYPFGNIVDCSYDSANTENFSINGALPGQIYSILITNYDGDPGFIKFQQLPSSTGSTNCEILYSVNAGPDQRYCGQNSARITATASTPATSQQPTFTWFIDDAPFSPTIISTTGLSQTIEVTEPGSHRYTVEITVPNASNTQPIIDEVVVVLGPAVNAVDPTEYVLCDDSDPATLGFTQFDLTTLYAQALGTMDPADYTISVFLDEPSANVGTVGAISPADAFTNTVANTQLVYIRVQSIAVPECFDVVAARLTVRTSQAVDARFEYPSAIVCISDPNPLVQPIDTTTFTAGGAFSYNATTGLDLNTTTGEINLAGSLPGTYRIFYTITADTDTAVCRPYAQEFFDITITTGGTAVTGFSYATPVCISGTNPTPIPVTGFVTGGTYSLISGSGLVFDPNTGEIDLAASTSGTYTLEYEIVATGCGSGGTSQATIVINDLSPVTVGFTYNTVCQNATTNPTPVKAGGFTEGGTWSSADAGIVVDATTGAVNLSQSVAGVYTIEYSVNQNDSTCTAGGTQTAQITINAGINPNTVFMYADDSFCAGSASVFPQGSFDAGGTFTAPSGLVINSVTGELNIAGSTPGVYEVRYAIEADPATCRNRSEDSFTITIEDELDVTISDECQNNNYILTASPSTGSYTYIWRNAQGDQVGNDYTFNVSNYINSMSSEPTYPMNFTVTVDNAGCQSTETFAVTGTFCTIQKGISPNNDGKNDTFDLTGFNVKKLTIYNRYGKEVYSFKNYTNEWRGQADNGNDLPDGTYYYVIERDGVEGKSGWIQINRQRN